MSRPQPIPGEVWPTRLIKVHNNDVLVIGRASKNASAPGSSCSTPKLHPREPRLDNAYFGERTLSADHARIKKLENTNKYVLWDSGSQHGVVFKGKLLPKGVRVVIESTDTIGLVYDKKRSSPKAGSKLDTSETLDVLNGTVGELSGLADMVNNPDFVDASLNDTKVLLRFEIKPSFSKQYFFVSLVRIAPTVRRTQGSIDYILNDPEDIEKIDEYDVDGDVVENDFNDKQGFYQADFDDKVDYYDEEDVEYVDDVDPPSCYEEVPDEDNVVDESDSASENESDKGNMEENSEVDSEVSDYSSEEDDYDSNTDAFVHKLVGLSSLLEHAEADADTFSDNDGPTEVEVESVEAKSSSDDTSANNDVFSDDVVTEDNESDLSDISETEYYPIGNKKRNIEEVEKDESSKEDEDSERIIKKPTIKKNDHTLAKGIGLGLVMGSVATFSTLALMAEYVYNLN